MEAEYSVICGFCLGISFVVLLNTLENYRRFLRTKELEKALRDKILQIIKQQQEAYSNGICKAENTPVNTEKFDA